MQANFRTGRRPTATHEQIMQIGVNTPWQCVGIASYVPGAMSTHFNLDWMNQEALVPRCAPRGALEQRELNLLPTSEEVAMEAYSEFVGKATDLGFQLNRGMKNEVAAGAVDSPSIAQQQLDWAWE